MDNIKLISNLDSVCDCIPVVSTLTNAVILLLKLAMKVNLVANPVSPGLKDDIKMYAVYKSTAECFWNMIPLFSNMVNLLHLLAWGFDSKNDPFMSAVIRNNVEIVKVHLARYPNEPEDKMQRYLSQSVYSSSPEIVPLLLKSREWSQASLVNSLTGFPGTGHVEEANNLILDYLDRFNEITVNNDYRFKSQFIEFAKKGCFKTAERFLKYIPKLTLEDVEYLIAKHTFRSLRLSKEDNYILTEEQLDIIIDKLERFDFNSFEKYLNNLGGSLHDFYISIIVKNQYFNANLNIQEMVDAFFKAHIKSFYKLIAKLSPPNKKEICDLVVCVINEGLTPLVSLFMDKFESQLSNDDKIAIINRCEGGILRDAYLVSQAFECFFTTYCSDFTAEERDEIKQLLSDRRFRKLNFAAIKPVKIS